MRANEALTTDQLKTLEAGLRNAFGEHNLLARPATDSEVAEVLIGFAEALGCNEPGEAGLKLYMQVLGRVPAPALKEGAKDLAASHRFKRLPNPAEILAAAQPYMKDIEDNRKWFGIWISAVERKLQPDLVR